jgi:uncharacterized protein (TIGR03083 family)
MSELIDPPRAFGPLFTIERARLLDMLQALAPTDWGRPTPCPGWTVLGLGTHLVGDDLSFVAWQRDDHRGTPAPDGLDEDGFIDWLDELQLEWVHAARRLSPRLVVELLAWLGSEVSQIVATQDPSLVTANVSWASARPVPRWLDHARELSERWVHRQQLLQSLGHPEDLRADLTEPVLDGLRWAYPYRLGAVQRPEGTSVVVAVRGPEVERRWNLVSDGGGWHFRPAADGNPVAELRLTTSQAWRLLTNNYDRRRDGTTVPSGDDEIIDTLLRTRAIIGRVE